MLRWADNYAYKHFQILKNLENGAWKKTKEIYRCSFTFLIVTNWYKILCYYNYKLPVQCYANIVT